MDIKAVTVTILAFIVAIIVSIFIVMGMRAAYDFAERLREQQMENTPADMLQHIPPGTDVRHPSSRPDETVKEDPEDEAEKDRETTEESDEPVEEIKKEPEAEKEESNLEYAGNFEITAYTLREEECGKAPTHPAYGVTRSGKMAARGRTIAADWDVLPEGTRVYIEGVGERTVEDIGGAVQQQKIDLFMGDPEVNPDVVAEALAFGRKELKVYIIND